MSKILEYFECLKDPREIQREKAEIRYQRHISAKEDNEFTCALISCGEPGFGGIDIDLVLR
jgi:hypothetical protein